MIYDDLERELAALGVAKPRRHVKINQILMLRRRGMSDHEIGQRFGMLAGEVRRRRRNAIVDDYKAGMAVVEMMRRHRMSSSQVYINLQRAGVELRQPPVSDDVVIDRYQSHTSADGCLDGTVCRRIRSTGLSLRSEEVEPPPRDELEDALLHWGELGTAQEYHVTVKHVRRWCAHYGITGGQDEQDD